MPILCQWCEFLSVKGGDIAADTASGPGGRFKDQRESRKGKDEEDASVGDRKKE